MENIEENVVTKGAKPADPMPSSGIPVEDLGGPTPENYKPDDDSAKLKDPALTLAQVKDVVNAKAMKAEEAETEEEVIEEEEATTDEVVAEEEETTDEVVAEEETSEEEVIEEEESYDVEADVAALLEGEELSEEFQNKAKTIFEAAIRMKLKEEMTHLEEKYEAKLATQIDEAQEQMAEKVDDYLNYVVEEWMKANEVAMEHKLKAEIAEGFMTGLKGLFEQHNISVPEEQFDMLDAASEKVAELEDKLNEALESNIELNKVNADLKRTDILLDVASDLADTEVEKFAGLTENIEYMSEEDFREKVETIKEGYFPKAQATQPSDDTAAPVEGQEEVDLSDSMGSYMSAISRTHLREKAEA